jgi:hypothetical protein
MIFVLYSAFLIPARLGFESEKHAAIISEILDFASECWFMFDIAITFRMGYVDGDTQEYVDNLDTIKSTYLRGWFALDFISSLPIKTLTLVSPNVSAVKHYLSEMLLI